jgi:hypothetical protein
VVPIVSTFHLETSLKVIPLTKPMMNTLSKAVHTSKTFVLTQHTNDVYVLLLSLWLSYAGISLERRSTIGKVRMGFHIESIRSRSDAQH